LAVLLETTDPAVNPRKARNRYLYIDRAAVQRAEWHRRNGLGREPDANERHTIGREWHSSLLQHCLRELCYPFSMVDSSGKAGGEDEALE
jgi:hypothetical protein